MMKKMIFANLYTPKEENEEENKRENLVFRTEDGNKGIRRVETDPNKKC